MGHNINGHRKKQYHALNGNGYASGHSLGASTVTEQSSEAEPTQRKSGLHHADAITRQRRDGDKTAARSSEKVDKSDKTDARASEKDDIPSARTSSSPSASAKSPSASAKISRKRGSDGPQSPSKRSNSAELA